jgi:hypothetical protein
MRLAGGDPATPELSDQAKGDRAPDVGVASDPPKTPAIASDEFVAGHCDGIIESVPAISAALDHR